ncbi:MAG: GC-type dockerin domain-anchored protein [Phycisphaerales bacterium JB061]
MAVFSAAGSVIAQPVYEIAYQFDGQPETVQVESEPFGVFAEADALIEPNRQSLNMRFPFTSHRLAGLAAVTGDIFRDREPRPALFSRGRSSVTFDDLVFSADGTDPIAVDLVINFGSGQFLVSGGTVVIGVETVTDLEVEVAGDLRTGQSRVFFDDAARFNIERSGFLADLPLDRHATIEDLVVPVNTPISLRFEVARSISIPAGEGIITVTHVEPDPGRPAPGLPTTRPVFNLPDGVTVNSLQAGIRDNRFIVCYADLDFDSELTIFDFLAFQNLFDAGDPFADFDRDGELTLFDFLAFQNAFDAGCP